MLLSSFTSVTTFAASLPLLVLSFLGGTVTGDSNVVTINSVDEFIQFSNNVNTRAQYAGTTVFLNSDLAFTDELSSQFNPIGNVSSYHFKGTFDGQGHIISNLKINSNSQYVGLFSYSSGLAIKNIVMDGSCAVTSSYNLISSTDPALVGGIIGQFQTNSRQSLIESIVNMASVSFVGNAGGDLYLGSISGVGYSSKYKFIIRNCANYGSVRNEGTFSVTGGIGGIIGHFLQGEKYIQNCINHGTITYNGENAAAYVGGIAGFGSAGTIVFDNCVNMGKITINNKDITCVGNVVGHIGEVDYSEIIHCYWSSITDWDNACGCSSSTLTLTDSCVFDSSSFILSSSVSIESYSGNSLVDTLNAGSDNHNSDYYSHWALNKGSFPVSFIINNRQKSFTLSSHLILLPNLKDKNGKEFDGWYTDKEYTDKLSNYNINNGATSLYGKFDDNTTCYTISFDTRGGNSVSSMTRLPGVSVTLPSSSTRENCKFGWWEDVNGDKVSTNFIVPSQNIVLYAVWVCTHISTLSDLVAFSKAVNSGNKYAGTTVYLDSDIDFTDELSKQFEPIGVNSTYQFRGTFDGQGHIIRNLTVSSSSEYIGVFGYPNGATIRNVVIDSSCFFTTRNNTFEEIRIGSITGRCYGCVIENIVNMADITFTSKATKHTWIGGIVGDLSSNNGNTMRNCVNYGAITFAGNSEKNTYLGGTIGESYGRIISNCANYGNIINSGTTNSILIIGGIAGIGWNGTIDNCLSVGKISTTKPSNRIGGIIGQVGYNKDAGITHCYWTSNVGYTNVYGYNNSFIYVTDSTMIPSLNATIMNEMNNYVENNDDKSLSKWFILDLNRGKINDIDQEVLIVTQSYFPDPVKEGHTFLSWSTDAGCTTKYDHKGTDTYIHACFDANKYNVTFDFENGTTASKEVTYGDIYGDLPRPEKEGHTFVGWYTGKDGEGDKITNDTTVNIGSDHTLYTVYNVNTYTMTFDFGNGTTAKAILEFEETIKYPADLEREGYTFDGWDNKLDKIPANDTTITALWTINNYTLTFIFDNGTEPETRILNYSQKIKYPADPEREGYIFDEWNNKPDTMPANDTTITALWTINNYTLTFIFDNGTEPETRILNYSQKIEYPANPEREGYSFDGWDNKLDKMPANDTTITALWTINNYTLTFIFDNGTESETRILNYSQEIEYPSNPEKEGYTFDKWNGKPDTIPANDTTIIALWTINNYTLTFIFDNGTEPETRILNYSQKIDYPANPEKEGYTFDEWNNKPDTMSANDTTITALWKINNYTLTFIFDNGAESETRILNYSQKIEYPSDPEREGYKFTNWSSKPETMPAHNLTVTAQWTEKISSFVEIVFWSKDMSQEEAEKIITAYVDGDFVIERFENDGKTGEIRVIIKFTDKEEAENFVENVKSGSNILIKGASVVDEPIHSLSPSVNFLSYYMYIF